jgi:hypothetical protein
MAWEPMLGHIGDEIGDEISRKQGKKVHWASTRTETQISTKFVLSLFFLNAFNQSFLLLCYFSYKCVRESESLVHLIMSLKHFIPLFNKFSLLCKQQQPGGGGGGSIIK